MSFIPIIPAGNVCREATSCCQHVWILLLGLCAPGAPGAIRGRALGQGLQELQELLTGTLHTCSSELVAPGPS